MQNGGDGWVFICDNTMRESSDTMHCQVLKNLDFWLEGSGRFEKEQGGARTTNPLPLSPGPPEL